MSAPRAVPVVAPEGDLARSMIRFCRLLRQWQLPLAADCAQVALQAPPSAIGRDTVTALQSGIVFGAVGATEGIVSRMRAKIGKHAKVVATGGLADVVADETGVIDVVEPNLNLLGLRVHYESVQKAGAPRRSAQ